MINRIFFFSSLFISINCNSQITDIKLSDNVKLDRVYLGLVSNTSVNTTDFEHESNGSLQSGLMLTYLLTERLKLRSFGVVKL